MSVELSQKLEEKSRVVKEQTAGELEGDVIALEIAIKERVAWLEDNNSLLCGAPTRPVFSKRYTVKSSSAARNRDYNTEIRLAKMEERIIMAKLTAEQRALIGDIRRRTRESIAREDLVIRAEYAAYMADNPAYAGLSEGDIQIAERDLDKCLKSMGSKLLRDMESEIDTVTAEARAQRRHGTPRGSALSREQLHGESKAVEEYRRDAIARYRRTKEDLEAAEVEEMACFDAEAPGLLSRGVSEASIKKYRQEALESCRKTNASKLHRLGKSINREVRMLAAKDMETAARQEHPSQLAAMMESYLATCVDTDYTPGACSAAEKQEDIANTIDLGFEQSEGDWASFLSIASYYLSMLDQPKAQKDRMMRLYAVLLLSSGSSSAPPDSAFGELERKIESLRSKRDTLLRDVRFLDARIKQRVIPEKRKKPRKDPEPSRYTKAYMEYIAKAPSAVLPSGQRCKSGESEPKAPCMDAREMQALMNAASKAKKTRVYYSSHELREARDKMDR